VPGGPKEKIGAQEKESGTHERLSGRKNQTKTTGACDARDMWGRKKSALGFSSQRTEGGGWGRGELGLEDVHLGNARSSRLSTSESGEAG